MNRQPLEYKSEFRLLQAEEKNLADQGSSSQPSGLQHGRKLNLLANIEERSVRG
jgi:hypothetical protein